MKMNKMMNKLRQDMKKKKVIIFDIQDDFKNFIKDLMPQRSLWKGLKAKIKNK